MGSCLGKPSKRPANPASVPVSSSTRTAAGTTANPVAATSASPSDAQQRAAEAAQRRLDTTNAKNTGPIATRLAAQKHGSPALKQAAQQNLQDRENVRIIYD